MDISLATLGVRKEKIIEQIATFKEYQDFISAGMEARRHRDTAAWILGCLALGVEKKYGQNSIDGYAKEIGVSTGSLETYRWTVKQYLSDDPNYVPPELVSFGVLQVAAKLSPEERAKMIDDAADGYMTVERARVEVKKLNGTNVPEKPRFKLVFCETHKKWCFVPENPEVFHAFHDGI